MTPPVHFLGKAPIFRLVVSLSLGIVQQHQAALPFSWLLPSWLACLLLLLLHEFLPLRFKYRFMTPAGLLIHALMSLSGGLLVWRQDISRTAKWMDERSDGSYLVLSL